LALIVGPLFRVVVGTVDILTVSHTTKRGSATGVTDGSGVHLVIIAGVNLPQVVVTAQLLGDVEDRIEFLGHDVIALDAGLIADIKRRGHCGAEVHTFTTVPCVADAFIEHGAKFGQAIGYLVVFEQVGASAALGSAESQKDQHRILSNVIVGVTPVGVANIIDTVCPTTVSSVCNANRLAVVGGRELEKTPIRKKTENLIRGRHNAHN